MWGGRGAVGSVFVRARMVVFVCLQITCHRIEGFPKDCDRSHVSRIAQCSCVCVCCSSCTWRLPDARFAWRRENNLRSRFRRKGRVVRCNQTGAEHAAGFVFVQRLIPAQLQAAAALPPPLPSASSTASSADGRVDPDAKVGMDVNASAEANAAAEDRRAHV